MKNKIIILSVLVLFFAPLFSSAYSIDPVNVTIVVASSGQESSFNFKIQEPGEECKEVCDYDEFGEYCWQECQSIWEDKESFSLQTENLTASRLVENVWPGGVRIIQDDALGFKVSGVICVSGNPDDSFHYQQNGVVIYPQSGSNITCTFTNIKAQNPVLIVPGLTGTEMKKDSALLWLDLSKMFTDVGDSFLDVLGFNNDLTSSDSSVSVLNVIGVAKLFGADVFNYTKGLIDEFRSQEYIEGKNLFLFPYDWRYGVSGKYTNGKNNSDLLKEKIDEILQETGSSEVDVVAHSMGGLIVKKYVMDNPTNNNIGKAVFVGVPNTGAPEAVKILLQGDNFGIPWLADAEVKKISENFPASYDLLPSRQYYDTSYLALVDIGWGIGNPTEKNLNYDEAKSYLTGDKGLNEQALINAENLHTQNFDNYDLRTAGVDLYSITGCKSPTIAQIAEVKSKDILGNSHTEYAGVKETSGDGTVPFGSSDSIAVDDDNVFYVIKANHGKMLSADGSRQEIVNLISGSNLDIGDKVITRTVLSADNTKCQLTGFWISKHSPVLIEALDQDGKRAGIASDGSIQNDIPGAAYEVMGEQAFIFLPTDDGQVYSVNMQGTGAGTYTIKVQDIVNSQAGQTQVFSNLPVTAELTGQINLVGATTLLVKQTANSVPETILPQATLTAEQSDDYFTPVSTATLDGTAGQAGFYKSDVKVNIKATDDLSGVLNVQYNLDNAGFQKITGDTASFIVLTEGKHTVIFFSADKNGNNEQEKTVEFTIDKTAPEAVIEFDQVAKDIKFTGKDNSQVSVSDKDDTTTLTDQAGNTTEIKLLNKNRKMLRMVSGIKSIKYNGVSANTSRTLMSYLWVFDWKKNLIALSQSVLYKNGYNILAVYDGKNTRLMGKDSSGRILKTLKGLKIIKITTNKGDLTWSY